MRTSYVVAALAGSTYASLEAYGGAPGYGTSSSTPAATAPAYGASSSTAAPAASTTYACNPAHQYPEGQVCTTISGSLTLVSTTGTYSAPVSATTLTNVIGETTTYCPEAASSGSASASVSSPEGHTYTVVSSELLTVTSCSGGCSKGTASATPSVSKPAFAPSVPASPSFSVPSQSKTVPGSGASTISVSKPASSPSVPVYSGSNSSTPVSAPSGSVPVHGASTTPVSPVRSTTIPAVPVSSGNGTASVPGKAPSASVPGYGVSSTPVSPIGSTSVPVVPVSSGFHSESASVPGSAPSTSAPGHGASTSSLITASKPSTTPVSPFGYGNKTVPATTGAVSATHSLPATYTGGASKMAGGALVGAAGFFAAFFL